VVFGLRGNGYCEKKKKNVLDYGGHISPRDFVNLINFEN
jgi:hypothetical protein